MPYLCQACNKTTNKWSGKCPNCGQWNSIITIEEKDIKGQASRFGNYQASYHLSEDSKVPQALYQATTMSELNNVLGGGVVSGSLILLSGEPGIGKSTLILQILDSIKNGLYISGEETAQQILWRANRLKTNLDNFKFLDETVLENIIATVLQEKPGLVVVDSIQTIYSTQIPNEPGNLSQIRLCTNKLLELSKKTKIPIIIIGHITKDGAVAGPKTLEHLVDVVLYLEGDEQYGYRLLRSSKNRYGSTKNIGLFEMTGEGLKEIKDPTMFFLESEFTAQKPSVFTIVTEGQRYFMVEVQALVSKTMFGYPQRKSVGYDLNRLHILIAILSKRLHLPLDNQDIYINVTGGLKIKDLSADLAVAAAILNSFYNHQLNDKIFAMGEIGLNGEIRSLPLMDEKLANALSLGFKQIYAPSGKATRKGVKNINTLAELNAIFKP
ncbi:MAG TPA: DNA repair protein RadA [bacterium]|nr:DNA repair protein RadA [bacterium]